MTAKAKELVDKVYNSMKEAYKARTDMPIAATSFERFTLPSGSMNEAGAILGTATAPSGFRKVKSVADLRPYKANDALAMLAATDKVGTHSDTDDEIDLFPKNTASLAVSNAVLEEGALQEKIDRFKRDLLKTYIHEATHGDVRNRRLESNIAKAREIYKRNKDEEYKGKKDNKYIKWDDSVSEDDYVEEWLRKHIKAYYDNFKGAGRDYAPIYAGSQQGHDEAPSEVRAILTRVLSNAYDRNGVFDNSIDENGLYDIMKVAKQVIPTEELLDAYGVYLLADVQDPKARKRYIKHLWQMNTPEYLTKSLNNPSHLGLVSDERMKDVK